MEVHDTGRAQLAAREAPAMLVVPHEIVVILAEEVPVGLAFLGVAMPCIQNRADLGRRQIIGEVDDDVGYVVTGCREERSDAVERLAIGGAAVGAEVGP